MTFGRYVYLYNRTSVCGYHIHFKYTPTPGLAMCWVLGIVLRLHLQNMLLLINKPIRWLMFMTVDFYIDAIIIFFQIRGTLTYVRGHWWQPVWAVQLAYWFKYQTVVKGGGSHTRSCQKAFQLGLLSRMKRIKNLFPMHRYTCKDRVNTPGYRYYTGQKIKNAPVDWRWTVK